MDNFDDLFNSENLKKLPISERPFKSKLDDVFQYGCRDPLIEASSNNRANAAFVVLARNSEIDGVILSMRSLERRFNQWFNYPWIFLNDEPFTKEFERRVEEVASGDFKFGIISKKNWNFKNQNDIYFKESIENQGDRGIMYGNLQSYHSMCRFYSGFFFEHPLVQNLDWYWRVEPDVEFYCDLTYDPFIEMEKNGKLYGYTIAIKELVDTVPNLFKYTKKFIIESKIKLPNTWKFFSNNFKFFNGLNEDKYMDVSNLNEFWKKLKKLSILSYSQTSPSLLTNKNLLQNIISNSKNPINNPIPEKYNNENYNLCHFWSNFEIASNKLFTSPEYKSYYQFLENSNGFFTERWGDAPIHSLAAGMFLSLDQIHYFRDIGYKHSTLGHCPFNAPSPFQKPYKSGPLFKHQVLPEDEIYYADYDKPVHSDSIGASGCRCRCPSGHREIENSGGSCSPLWLQLTNDEYNNAKSNGDSEFVGGLGDFNFLDLDKIEKLAFQSLDKWIKKGGKLQDWVFTDEEIKLWSKTYV